MPKKIVAGNWKMNKTFDEAKQLTAEIQSNIAKVPSDVTLIISPPTLYLSSLSSKVLSPLKLSAQNCSNMGHGAFTGEISASMLKSVGIHYCIVGHSERRSYYNESDEFIGEKVSALIDEGLSPIFCCGESLEEREADIYFKVVQKQIEAGLFHLENEEFNNVIIAYEPVWAIGTGKTASPNQAQEMHSFIRSLIADKFGNDAANDCSLLYGGSCKPSNAQELFSQKDIDGGLIGGAALDADSFIQIANSY